MAHSSGNVWSGAVGSVHELPHKLGVRELLEVKDDVIIVLSRCVLCCHGGTNGLAVGHTKVVEDVRDVLSLAKLKGTFGSVPPDAASKQPGGWSKLLNLELAGRRNPQKKGYNPDNFENPEASYSTSYVVRCQFSGAAKSQLRCRCCSSTIKNL